MKIIEKIKQKLAKLFETVDWREFRIGMIVFFCFFTLIAIGMLVSGVWEFDILLLIYFYGGGLIVSTFFNLMNPNNQKKNE